MTQHRTKCDKVQHTFLTLALIGLPQACRVDGSRPPRGVADTDPVYKTIDERVPADLQHVMARISRPFQRRHRRMSSPGFY